MSAEIERRMSWRSVSPFYADSMEVICGRDIWQRLTQSEWDALPWQDKPTSVIFTGDDRMDQYQTLRRWAETHEQPVRDVRLDERQPAEWTEVP